MLWNNVCQYSTQHDLKEEDVKVFQVLGISHIAVLSRHHLRKSTKQWLHPQKVFKVLPIDFPLWSPLVVSPLLLGPPRNILLRLNLDFLIWPDLIYCISEKPRTRIWKSFTSDCLLAVILEPRPSQAAITTNWTIQDPIHSFFKKFGQADLFLPDLPDQAAVWTVSWSL